VTLNERTPPVEGSGHQRLEWILHDIVEENVDLGPLEDEHDFSRREVGSVALEAGLLGVEGRSRGEQVGGLLPGAALQTSDDRNLANRAS
jgi:hypothetical protein